jgi:hypothetical protein
MPVFKSLNNLKILWQTYQSTTYNCVKIHLTTPKNPLSHPTKSVQNRPHLQKLPTSFQQPPLYLRIKKISDLSAADIFPQKTTYLCICKTKTNESIK